MKTQRIVLIGGGGHAKVLAEVIRSMGAAFELIGFVDPLPCSETVSALNLRRIGDDSALADLNGVDLAAMGVGAVGVSPLRRTLTQRIEAMGFRFPPLVHARGIVSSSASLEDGAVVMAGAIVQAAARLGRHTVVNSGAIVEHDVSLGEFAQVAPGAAVGGGAIIGKDCYLGLGARVRDHVVIGAGVLVAMGAVVVSNVREGMSVRGVPAR